MAEPTFSVCVYCGSRPGAEPHYTAAAEQVARDAQVHAQATGAHYAGDPDPYRHPSDEEDATG